MKNLLLSLTLISSVYFGYGQLYVAPNNNGTPGNPLDDVPSYVFVNDIQLFVENDVNLTRNTNTTTQLASIYLRNDGQLLQGSGSTLNSGNGWLSVYQESDADAWNYIFWSSPVSQALTGTPGNTTYGVRTLYDPVDITESTQTLTTSAWNSIDGNPFTISTRWTYTWNTPSQSWVRAYANFAAPAGRGFIMKGVGTANADITYDFRGRPNNGEFIIPTQTGVPFFDGNLYDYTLAGNPYPSALNLYRVAYDSDNWIGPPSGGNPGTTAIINSFCYWDEDRGVNSHLYSQNRGGYGVWLPGVDENDPGTYTVAPFLAYNSDGTQNGNPGGLFGAHYERLNAPIGQGFMIRANVTDDVHIKNSHRVFVREGAANFSQFRNPTGGSVTSSTGISNVPPNTTPFDTKPQIRIHTYFGENSHFRDMVLLFNDNATDRFDYLKDATHPMDAALADAYFTINADSPDERKDLVIQTIPFDDPQKRVPFSLKLDEPEIVRVKVVNQINTPFQKAYLFDNQDSSYKEITSDRSALLYLDEGVYEGRFFIVFRGLTNNDDTASEDGTKRLTNEGNFKESFESTNVVFFQNNTLRQLEVFNEDELNIKLAQIFDMTGKLVYSDKNLGNSSKFTFPTYNLSSSVYLVKLTTTNNTVIDYKISVYNK